MPGWVGAAAAARAMSITELRARSRSRWCCRSASARADPYSRLWRVMAVTGTKERRWPTSARVLASAVVEASGSAGTSTTEAHGSLERMIQSSSAARASSLGRSPVP